MVGRILKFDATAHKTVDNLLPWFVNGTLAGDELAQVVRHLHECEHCKREVEWLRKLQASNSDSNLALDASASLQKLLPRLDPPGRRTRLMPQAPGWARFWRHVQPGMRWSMAAAFAVLLALGFLLQPVLKPAAPYHTLGASGAIAPAQGNLVIVFAAGTTMAELNRILRVNDARVVDGPTVAGAYIVEVPAGHQASVRQALLRENAVKLAEPLGPEGAP